MGRILNTPTMMVVADGDDITSWDREIEAFNGVATSRKELIVMPATSHMTLYSNRSRLEIAAAAAAGFMVKHLTADTPIELQAALGARSA